MKHYEMDQEKYTHPRIFKLNKPTPVIGDMISIKGMGTFVCNGSSDDPIGGHCTADKCCFFCGNCCTAANYIFCVGAHWFTPVEDSL